MIVKRCKTHPLHKGNAWQPILPGIALFFILGFMAPAASQTERFSRRLRGDYLATAFNSVLATNHAYYAVGIAVKDTFGRIATGPWFAKFNLQGDLIFQDCMLDALADWEIWYPTLALNHRGQLTTQGYRIPQVNLSDTISMFYIAYDTSGAVQEWVQYKTLSTYPAWGIPRGFIPTSDSGYVFATNECLCPPNDYNWDIGLTRIDQSGQIIWQKNYPHAFFDFLPPGVLLEDSDGGFISGSWQSKANLPSNQGPYSYTRLVKTDKTGNKIWDYISPPSAGYQTGPWGLTKSDDGGLVFATGIAQPAKIGDAWEYYTPYWVVKKLDSLRNSVWETPFRTNFPGDAITPANHNVFTILNLEGNQGFAGVGMAYDSIAQDSVSFPRGWIVRIAENGDSLWMREFRFISFASHELRDVAAAPDGGFVMVGEIRRMTIDTFPQQAWIIKTDAYGCLTPDCQLSAVAEPAGSGQPAIQVSLYPNPADQYLNFTIDYTPGFQPDAPLFWQIRHQNGDRKTLQRYRAEQGLTEVVDVSDWAPGMYYLEILGAPGSSISAHAFVVLH